ncbi:MAG: glycosyltransferase family 4 protein [Bacteroidota bacterium]
MEVLFITHKYPPSIGGMQKHSYELATRLRKYCSVHTIIYQEDRSRILFFLRLKHRIKKVLKANPNIALIYLNDALMATLSIWLKKYTDLPVVASFHGLDIVFPSVIYQKWIVPKLHQLDGIIAVSRPTAEECRKRGFDPQKIYSISNGIDHDLADQGQQVGYRKILEQKLGRSLKGKRILMSLGRPVRRKGFCWFIKEVLPQLDSNTLFILVGPKGNTHPISQCLLSSLPRDLKHKVELFFGMGSDGYELQQLLHQAPHQDRLIHLGPQTFPDIIQIISIADLFIVPNIKVEGDFEGFGLVALEAAICGTPVVAAQIEGLQEAIVDGKNGYGVPSENPQAWVKKIRTLLAQPDELLAFGEQARDYTMAQYDWDKMVAAYFQVFQKLTRPPLVSAVSLSSSILDTPKPI